MFKSHFDPPAWGEMGRVRSRGCHNKGEKEQCEKDGRDNKGLVWKGNHQPGYCQAANDLPFIH